MYSAPSLEEYVGGNQLITLGEAVEMYGLGTPRLKYYLFLYDKNFMLSKKLELDKSDKNRPDLSSKSVGYLKNKLCLFQSGEKGGKTEAWVQIVNKTTLEVNSKETKKLADFPFKSDDLCCTRFYFKNEC
jgi:hypothetical protein